MAVSGGIIKTKINLQVWYKNTIFAQVINKTNTMIDLEMLTDRELAVLIIQYNGQRGTDKQVDRYLNFTSSREMMITFLKLRIPQ